MKRFLGFVLFLIVVLALFNRPLGLLFGEGWFQGLCAPFSSFAWLFRVPWPFPDLPSDPDGHICFWVFVGVILCIASWVILVSTIIVIGCSILGVPKKDEQKYIIRQDYPEEGEGCVRDEH